MLHAKTINVQAFNSLQVNGGCGSFIINQYVYGMNEWNCVKSRIAWSR